MVLALDEETMNIQKLEITGIRLIGFFFLFTTAHHISGAVMASYYELNDPAYESLFEAMASAQFVTQSVLAISVLLISVIAMLRPDWVQKRWRRIDEEDESYFDTTSLTLFRMAALMMALNFAQESLSDFIQIAMITNTSFSGFNASQTISNLVLFVISLYLFIKPEVINKWK